jgi:hypothetical protein
MMESINLKTFAKNIATTKLKQSSKIVIRDVDEEPKNKFVAYADDKNESYDVVIEINENDEVIDSDCDCEIKGLCIHRIAFLLYLSEKKGKPKQVRARKQSPTDVLIQNLDTNTLKNWIHELLKKNKDLEFLFLTEFAVNTEEYTKTKVTSLINSSIKSIIKTRKNIETNELKKIIDLLEVSLKPVIKFCIDDLSNPDKLEILLFIFDELVAFENRIYSTSVKVIRFKEKISKQIIDSFSNKNDDLNWQKITDLHFDFILNDKLDTISETYFNHLKLLYNACLNNQFRKKYFAKKAEKFSINLNEKKLTFGIEISTFILEILFENDLFEKNYSLFRSYRYENEYNLSLIDKLIDINKTKEAEEMALAQVANNYYVDYNFPYWSRLAKIYISQNDFIKITNILINTVGIEMNFDHFLIIKGNLPEVEFKKFKSNLLGRTKNKFSSSNNAPQFYFKILNDDKNYRKMIDSISEYTDYDVIFEHRIALFLENKIEFLKKIFTIESGNFYYRNKEYNLEYREKLADWVLQAYDEDILKNLDSILKLSFGRKFQDLLMKKTTTK